MKGSIYAPLAARLGGISGIRLKSVDTVVATVAVSAIMSAVASFVVVSNVYEALHGQPSRGAAMQTASATQSAPGPASAPARRYPTAEAAPAFAGLPLFHDEGPAARSAMKPADITFEMASLPQVSRPLGSASFTAPAIAPPATQPPLVQAPLVRAARNVSPEIAFDLRTPLARPENAAPQIAQPPVAEERALDESPALVSVSPRPSLRPRAVVALAAARADARSGDPAASDTIEVARAETPDAAIRPAALSDSPRRASLFPPRAGANPCSSRLARGIPRRPGNAAAGSSLMASLGNASGSGRDSAIVAEAMRGNVPDHLRALQPVRFTGMAGGRQTEIVVCVTPDYLAVGSDGDHVRVPLGLPAALRVADAFDMMLPTTRMVDAIYAQAQLRMAPRPMTPGPQMSSTDYFLRHDATLDAQFAEAGGRHGLLVAGHKKDLVIANRLSNARGRVAIYGWHRGNGDPIQPLSTVHGEYYADYSHGIRLVSRTAYVDGRAVDLRALLTDAAYAGLLNREGPLTTATIRLASL